MGNQRLEPLTMAQTQHLPRWPPRPSSLGKMNSGWHQRGDSSSSSSSSSSSNRHHSHPDEGTYPTSTPPLIASSIAASKTDLPPAYRRECHEALDEDPSVLSGPIFRGDGNSYCCTCEGLELASRDLCCRASWESCSTATTASIDIEQGHRLGLGTCASVSECHAPTAAVAKALGKLGSGRGGNGSSTGGGGGDGGGAIPSRSTPGPLRLRFSPSVTMVGGGGSDCKRRTAGAAAATNTCLPYAAAAEEEEGVGAGTSAHAGNTPVVTTRTMAGEDEVGGEERERSRGQAKARVMSMGRVGPHSPATPARGLAVRASPGSGGNGGSDGGGGGDYGNCGASTGSSSSSTAFALLAPPVLLLPNEDAFVSSDGQRFVPRRNGMHTSWRRRRAVDENNNNNNNARTAAAVGNPLTQSPPQLPPQLHPPSISAALSGAGATMPPRDCAAPDTTRYAMGADELIARSTPSKQQQEQQEQQPEDRPVRLFLRRSRPALAPQAVNISSCARNVPADGSGATWGTGSSGRVDVGPYAGSGVGGKTVSAAMPCVGTYSSARTHGGGGRGLRSLQAGGITAGAGDSGGAGGRRRPTSEFTTPTSVRARDGRAATVSAINLRQPAAAARRERPRHISPSLSSAGSLGAGGDRGSGDTASSPATTELLSSAAARKNLARVARASKVGTKADPVTLYRQRQEQEKARRASAAARSRRRAISDGREGYSVCKRTGGLGWRGRAGAAVSGSVLLAGWR